MIIHNLNRNSPKITQITQTRSLKILNCSTVNDKTQNGLYRIHLHRSVRTNSLMFTILSLHYNWA